MGKALNFVVLTTSLLGTVCAQPAPIAVHPHEAGGVEVALMEVKRTSGNTITVTWEYRNKTKEPKQLTKERTGWYDPYRLSVGSYLADAPHKIKYELLKDDERRPIAAKVGTPNSFIMVKPMATISNWAKYPGPPAGVRQVTVIIDGVQPFEDVTIQ
jgi:hypothetical protein